MQQTPKPRLAGRAVVLLRGGRAFEGTVSVGAGLVCFAGRRRLRLADRVEYRPADPRIWPMSEVHEIRFLNDEDDEDVAA